jgi:hypothetical protein
MFSGGFHCLLCGIDDTERKCLDLILPNRHRGRLLDFRHFSMFSDVSFSFQKNEHEDHFHTILYRRYMMHLDVSFLRVQSHFHFTTQEISSILRFFS